MAGSEPAIFIVDDDLHLRDFVVKLLQFSGFTDITTYDSGRTFLDQAAIRDGDCVILELRLPNVGGLAVQQELNDRGTRASVIVLTAYADVPTAVKAMRAGALDLIVKPFENEALVASVLRAVSGSYNGHDPRTANSKNVSRRFETLTPREKEVFDHLLRGWPNKSIAADLKLSTRTVETYRARVMEKMGAPSLAALIRMTLSDRE